jgi:DNA topoisomerase III
MSRILIIAEKPSVAADLAKALSKAPGLGRFTKTGDHYESEQGIITFARGHLVELKMPMTPEGKSLPWSFKHLPAIPPEFELQPIEDSRDRLRAVVKLAKDKSVGTIVNACDAGREGELIFHYIMAIGKIDKPVKRLWMQSMTPGAILEAWARLRDEDDMRPLADAAVCRSESDWLVGLNATRALTALNSRHGGFNITPAGRVQTPTLAILAERENQIQAFVARDYYEVHATFAVPGGDYPARWIDERFAKNPQDDQVREERIWEAAAAAAIRARCLGKTGVVSEESKEQRQSAKPLYDLTSLQRDASGRFGFSARRTLDIAQRLYERYKALTYPRTDSRYLPEDYVGTVRDTMGGLAAGLDRARAGFAAKVMDQHWIVKTPRIFNNAKVSDHFAIIPTGVIPEGLEADAAKLYDLVVKRFIAVFYPQAVFDVTTRITRISHPGGPVDAFKTQGRVLREPGWLEVYGRAAEEAGENATLVPVADGSRADAEEVEVKHEITKPPARFNEGTLLSAMENAGKLVEDEELAEAMKERGLGTPATRAATIEGLIAQKYIAREGRDLVVTPKGLDLIKLVKEIGVETLASPELTGDWEFRLKQMEGRKLARSTFMADIKDMTRRIVERAKAASDEMKLRVYDDVPAPCPLCQTAPLRHSDEHYSCSNPLCKWRVKTYVAQRELMPDELRTLLERGMVGPLTGFRNRFHKEFDAALKLDDKGKVVFEFGDSGDDSAESLEGAEAICEAALPGGGRAAVYETEKAYVCPDLKSPVEPKGVRMGKLILQRPIPREQAVKLFTTGKTDLLQGFVSSKSKKRFAAHLVLDPQTGKVGFEFAERPAGKAAAGKRPPFKKRAAKKAP